jgi:hypothetical protein
MSKPLLSIIIPSIRPQNIDRICGLIKAHTFCPYHIVVCGPIKPETNYPITFIEDFGSPVRAQCHAMEEARGKVITWLADNLLELTSAWDYMTCHGNLMPIVENEKLVRTAKYFESRNPTSQPEEYYKINSALKPCPHISNDAYLFNMGFMSREFYCKLGGWDCDFETTFFSHTDLAIRAYLAGAEVTFQYDELAYFDHEPGTTGTHAPIDAAHNNHDYPLYVSRWCQPQLPELKPLYTDS